MRSCTGSSAVFLCVVMAAMTAICFTLIWSAREYSVSSRADAILNLAGDSILSEWDQTIQSEYGLFFLQGTDGQLEDKLRHYALPSLQDMSGCSVSGMHISGGRFGAASTDAVRKQILACMKEESLLQLIPEKKPDGQPPGSHDDSLRVLRHGPTISSLPSRQLPEHNLADRARAAGQKLSHPMQLIAEGSEQYLLTSYCLEHFNSCLDGSHESHFFDYETEYILCGEMSDKENLQKVSLWLKELRFAPNLAHIYSDPAKRDLLAELSEILAPGLVGAAAGLAAATAWAWAESANDVKLLLNGYPVPAVKTEKNWALDVSNILHSEDAGMILPDETEGFHYSQYVRILLSMEDDTMMISRILDLIQINMRKNTDRNFLINDWFTGISMTVKINGREFSYEKIY